MPSASKSNEEKEKHLLKQGDQLDQSFEIIELIGTGGMSEVYRAKQLRLGRVVAIKVLLESHSQKDSSRKKFQEEADMLARLSHPNITSVLDRGEYNGIPYLVLEYIDGKTVDIHIVEKLLTPELWIRVIDSCCEAISYIHEVGLVHLDIKPSNIMIDTKGIVKLADFGIARLLSADDDKKNKKTYSGTMNYMSPEQRQNSLDLDHRADIFALSVTFYKMLTRRYPESKYISVKRHNASLDTKIDDVLKKGMAEKPEDRYQSVRELCDELIACLVVEQIPSVTRRRLSSSSQILPKIKNLDGPPKKKNQEPKIEQKKENTKTKVSEPQKDKKSTKPAPIESKANSAKSPVFRTKNMLIASVAFILICTGAVIYFGSSSSLADPGNTKSQTASGDTQNTPSTTSNLNPQSSSSTNSTVKQTPQTPAPAPFFVPTSSRDLNREGNWSYLITYLSEGTYQYYIVDENGKKYHDSLNPQATQNGQHTVSEFSIPGGSVDAEGNRSEWPKVEDVSGEVVFRFQNNTYQKVYVIGSFNNWQSSAEYELK